ncbi:MAG TPA: hypothetical protein VHE35_26085 [Kofleriaceae bacterium]|nr:hypothetical protein [Kofleriaceae bacterium]
MTMLRARSLWSAIAVAGLAACSGGGGGGGGGDDVAADPDAAAVDAPVTDGAVVDARVVDASPDAAIDADVSMLPHFSFFVTSLAALRTLSGSANGFGGDLRFGETGPGAGLRGADKICATIAELSMPGSSAKQWRAFLSATNDGNGNVVNAIDRIGNGPWYDRLGRMLAPNKASLLGIRPAGGDAAIKNDFPNEDGVPNHNPDGTGEVDNHDFLTGTNLQGQLEAANRTCLDWTSATGNKTTEGSPRVGHTWPRGNTGMINSWMSSLVESGCRAGVNLIETGPPNPNDNTVGSGGGYGGFYCFALVP